MPSVVFLVFVFFTSIVISSSENGQVQASNNKHELWLKYSKIREKLFMDKLASVKSKQQRLGKSTKKIKTNFLIFFKLFSSWADVIGKYLRDRLNEKDYRSVLAFLYLAKDVKQREFNEECLKRFKSKALCITQTMPFYIWQKIEIEKLRNRIIG